MSYEFSNNWFSAVRSTWDQLIPQLAPRNILEIGSYEGASTIYLIQHLSNANGGEIHCIDNWRGGIEHSSTGFAASDMSSVEKRFHKNISVAIEKITNQVDVIVHKGLSAKKLAELYASGKGEYFDFIYVDGSHQAPDVLCDAVIGFKLLRIGGIMAFDDYLWAEPLAGGVDLLRCPKPAIDSFTNLNCRKLKILSAPLNQLYVRKLSD